MCVYVCVISIKIIHTVRVACMCLCLLYTLFKRSRQLACMCATNTYFIRQECHCPKLMRFGGGSDHIRSEKFLFHVSSRPCRAFTDF